MQAKASAKALEKTGKDAVKEGESERGGGHLIGAGSAGRVTGTEVGASSPPLAPPLPPSPHTLTAAEKAKLEAEVTKLQASMKEMEEEAGEAYVQRQEREAAVEANKGELEVARAEVCVGGGGGRGVVHNKGELEVARAEVCVRGGGKEG